MRAFGSAHVEAQPLLLRDRCEGENRGAGEQRACARQGATNWKSRRDSPYIMISWFMALRMLRRGPADEEGRSATWWSARCEGGAAHGDSSTCRTRNHSCRYKVDDGRAVRRGVCNGREGSAANAGVRERGIPSPSRGSEQRRHHRRRRSASLWVG